MTAAAALMVMSATASRPPLGPLLVVWLLSSAAFRIAARWLRPQTAFLGTLAFGPALAQTLCRAAGLDTCSACGQFMSSTAPHDCPIAIREGDTDMVALAYGQPWARTKASLTALGELAAAVLHSPVPRPALAQAAREASTRLGQVVEAGDVPWQFTQLALVVQDAARQGLPSDPRARAAALLDRASQLRAVAAGAHVVVAAPSTQEALRRRLALIDAVEILADTDLLTEDERRRVQIARESLRAGFTNAEDAQALAALLLRLAEEADA